MYTTINIAVFNSIVHGQYQITGKAGFRAKIDLTGVKNEILYFPGMARFRFYWLLGF